MKEFHITEEELLHAQKLHLGWKIRAPLLAVWGIFTAYLAFMAVDSGETVGLVWLVAWSAIMALILFLLFPAYRRRQLKSIYAEQKGLRREARITFDDDIVEWRSESGHARIPWNDLVKYKEDDTMFLVYEARNLMRVVPKRIFENSEELAQFAARLRQVGS